MERALLRPVPSGPAEPVEPAAALRHVAQLDANLSAREAETLALVTLAGRSRAEAARDTGLSAAEVGRAVASARKALRRSARPLAATGWCERAEGLISDRLDDALDEPGAARLAVHLRNCPRCVEHERRLVQALDALVAAYERQRPARPAALAVVRGEEAGPPPQSAAAPPAVSAAANRASAASEPVPPVRPARAGALGAAPPFLAWYALIALGMLGMLAASGLALAGVSL